MTGATPRDQRYPHRPALFLDAGASPHFSQGAQNRSAGVLAGGPEVLQNLRDLTRPRIPPRRARVRNATRYGSVRAFATSEATPP